MTRPPRSSAKDEMTATVDGEALERLVAAAQEGDRPAADRLVRAHDAWLRSVIYGVTGRPDLVEDIAQQVWAQVFERLDTLNDPKRLRPWLATIARNAAIDASVARKRRSSRTGTLEQAPEPAGDVRNFSPPEVIGGVELRDTLLRAVEALPALYREPFVLRHLEGWSYAEIGDVLELGVDTVETRLVRARRFLREMLNGKVER